MTHYVSSFIIPFRICKLEYFEGFTLQYKSLFQVVIFYNSLLSPPIAVFTLYSTTKVRRSPTVCLVKIIKNVQYFHMSQS